MEFLNYKLASSWPREDLGFSEMFSPYKHLQEEQKIENYFEAATRYKNVRTRKE